MVMNVPQMEGIYYWLAEQLLASQGLCPLEVVNSMELPIFSET
jgi:hypothetical protein